VGATPGDNVQEEKEEEGEEAEPLRALSVGIEFFGRLTVLKLALV
jgi:hypothetical protein